MAKKKFFVVIFFSLLSFFTLSFFFKLQAIYYSGGQTKGAFAKTILDTFNSLQSPAFTPSPIPPSPTPTPLIPKKSSYAIAVIGDSMVDTMGERLEYLEGALKEKYPKTEFRLYNYGMGAQNVEEGLARINVEFDHLDRHYPPLPRVAPDILIIGSYAYNPFTPHDRDRHWAALKKFAEEGRGITPNVYILAEVAPLRTGFGKGPNGVNWSENTAYEHSGRILELLENAVTLGKVMKVPVINAFDASLNKSTEEGNKKYVNSSDGIHPSVDGHKFTADRIVKTLQL